MTSLRSAQVHRFRSSVAVYLCGPRFKRGKWPETVYLTPKQARELAAALVAGADDCEAREFAASQFRTVEIIPEG